MTYEELLDIKMNKLKMKKEKNKNKVLDDYYRDLILDPDSITSIPNEILKKLVEVYGIVMVGGDKDYGGLYIGKERMISDISHQIFLGIASDPEFFISASIGGKNFTFNKIVVVNTPEFDYNDEHTLYINDWGCIDPTSVNVFIPKLTSRYTSVKFDAVHRRLYKIRK